MKGIRRVLKTFNFVENQRVQLEIPRANIYENLQLLLTGKITLADGSDSGTVKPLGAAGLMERIEWIVNSGNTTKSLRGDDLYQINAVDQQGRNALVVPASGDVQADTDIKASVFLNFEMPRGKEEVTRQTFYNSFTGDPVRNSLLQMAITFGNRESLFTGNDRTITFTGIKVDVIADREIIPMTERLRKQLFLGNKETTSEKEVIQSTDEFKVELGVGNQYKRVIILGIKAGVLDDTIVQNIKIVRNGEEVLRNLTFAQQKEANAKEYGIKSADLETGMAIVDFDPKNTMKDLESAVTASSFDLILKVGAPSGTTKVRVIKQEITPPPTRFY